MVPRGGAGAARTVLVLELAQGSQAWALARCEAALAACESCPATDGPEPVEWPWPWGPVIALLATQLVQARPGERVRVAYVDDDVDHERVLVWPVSEALRYVMSPDRDVWVEDLTAADHATGPCRCWPLAGECRRTALLEPGFVERPLPTEAEIGGAFHELDCGASGVSVMGALTPRVRGVWMLREPLGQTRFGEVIELTELDPVWGDQALSKGSDGHGRARLVGPSDVEALAEGRRQLLRDTLELPAIAVAGTGEAAPWRSDRALALRAPSHAPPPKAAGSDAGARPVEAEACRAVAVPRRLRRLRTRGLCGSTWAFTGSAARRGGNVARESSTEVYDDTPLEGPCAVLHLLKHMERFGGDPRNWVDKWCLEDRIGKSDRTFHELETLVVALMTGGSFEKICRRVQLIIDALAEP
ncbi:unnamed protein product, partial [Prorocentrum cordatum]